MGLIKRMRAEGRFNDAGEWAWFGMIAVIVVGIDVEDKVMPRAWHMNDALLFAWVGVEVVIGVMVGLMIGMVAGTVSKTASGTVARAIPILRQVPIGVVVGNSLGRLFFRNDDIATIICSIFAVVVYAFVARGPYKNRTKAVKGVPKWLSGVGVPVSSAAKELAPAPAEIPDWLQGLRLQEVEPSVPEAEQAPVGLMGKGAMPSPEEATAYFQRIVAGKEAELEAKAQAEADTRWNKILGKSG